MRVGLFTDAYYPDINGVVSSVATLKEALEKRGHTVFVISNHKGSDIDFKENILRLPGLELKKFYGYKLSSPIQFKGSDYIRDMNLDIIHVQTEAGIGMFARIMSKSFHIPLVYTYHTMYEDYTHYLNPLDLNLIDEGEKLIIRKFSKYWVNHSLAVIAPSMKTKKKLIDYGAHSPIFVIPTGLDLSHFDRRSLDQNILSSIRPSLNLTEEDHVVTFVGRIAKEKAIDIPIKALKYSKDENLHLVIVGKGTDLEYYQNLVHNLDLESRVHFTGMIDKPMVPYYYSAFDCFVSASVSETQGMTYIEALASGLCVFGRRDEVLDELIDEGITGYYFDDEIELAKKLDEFFVQDKEERISVSNKCIEKTIPYDTDIFARDVLDVYQFAIKQYEKKYTVEKMEDANDFLLVTFSSDGNKELRKLLIPLEDVVDLQLEINSVIHTELFDNYDELQSVYKAYSKVKQHCLQKDCCSFEIQKYCHRYLDLPNEDIDVVVHILEQKLLINDRIYAIDKAQYWQHSGKSINEISRKLRALHINEDFIQEALSKLDKEKERENVIWFVKHIKTSSNSQSRKMFSQRIIQKCLNAGFSFDDAQYALDQLEFKEDFDEKALEKSIRKAKRLYSNFEEDTKYNKIRMYCIRKGFSVDLIDNKLKEIEDD